MTKYILTAAFALLMFSCTKDKITLESPVVPPPPPPIHEEFSKASIIGLYDEEKGGFLFDKTTHQFAVNPKTLTFRILDNDGDKYVEITLSAMPTADDAVTAKLRSNVGLEDRTIENIILLRKDNENLWLWSDSAVTGLLLPWYDLDL